MCHIIKTAILVVLVASVGVEAKASSIRSSIGSNSSIKYVDWFDREGRLHRGPPPEAPMYQYDRPPPYIYQPNFEARREEWRRRRYWRCVNYGDCD